MTVVEQQLEQPRDRFADWSPGELRRVVVRLRDGDVVQVGTAPTRESALVLARSVMSEIDEPSGEWPRVGDRLVRPEAVVSVDVLEAA